MKSAVRGLLRGMGKQKEVCYVHALVQCVMQPALVWLFTFRMKLGIKGLWLTKTIDEVCICLGYAYVIIYHCSFEELAAASGQ